MRGLSLGLVCAAAVGGCGKSLPPFSQDQFLAAKEKCRAPDAFIIDAVPNTIGFRGTSDDHVEQAKCFKAELAGTNVDTVVIGSQLHEGR